MCVHAHVRFDFGLDPPRAARRFVSTLRSLRHFQRKGSRNSHLPCYTAHLKARPILDLLSAVFMRYDAFLQVLSVFAEEVEAMSPRTCRSRTFCQFNQIIGSLGLTACLGFCQHVHINCMCLCITDCMCLCGKRRFDHFQKGNVGGSSW